MSRPRKSRPEALIEVNKPHPWERIPDRWQHAICCSFLVIVSITFFAPLHFGNKSLIGSDTVNWRATAESILEYERSTGEPALWAGNVFGGMPAYMISYRSLVPQADTIVSLLRGVLWPSSHFIVLLFGMYLLVFFLTRMKWVSVLSAVAFGLTTYVPVILVAGHNSKFVALCYAPWLLLGFAYALRRPGVLASLLFAIALAVHLRAGHFQITYYVLVVMLVWWLGEGIQAIRTGSAGAFVSSTMALLAGGVLAGMMVAQPYLAQYEYKAFTIRGAAPGGGAGGLAWDYAMGWSQGVGELMTLVVADAYGGSDAYWGGKPFTGGPHYFTAVVAFLAAVGALRDRTVVARSLGAAAVVILLFSLGANLAFVNRPMFNYFPLFGAFRVPETWLSILAMVCAVLAGLGLKSLVENPPETSLVSSRVARGLTGFVVILLITAAAGPSLMDFEKEGERDRVVQQIARSNGVSADDPRVATAADSFLDEMRSERSSRFSEDAWRSIIALLLTTGIFLLYRRKKLPSAWLQVGVVLIVMVDLWSVDRRYLNDSKLTPSSNVEDTIPEYGFDRYILERKAESGERFRVLSLEGNPTTTARPSYYYESLSGYHGAKLRLYQDFLDRMLIAADGTLNLQALRLMNTRYVVARGELPGMRRVFTDEQTGFGVFEVAEYLPRAFLVDSLIQTSSAEAAWERLADPDLDLGRVAVVTPDLSLPPATRDSSNIPTSEIRSYTPHEIIIEAVTHRERLLVVSEVYYPAGWKATIDGAAAEIHRVNYLLRGVVLPPGSHTVHLVFDPASHRVGLWVAAATSLAVYGLVVVLIGLAIVGPRTSAGDQSSRDGT